MHPQPSTTRHTLAGSRSDHQIGRASTAQLEQHLESWLRGEATTGTGEREATRPLTMVEVLSRLTTCATPLAEDARRALRAPAHTTVGDAARSLLFARHDPAGPRCRSYRAAAYFFEQGGRMPFPARPPVVRQRQLAGAAS